MSNLSSVTLFHFTSSLEALKSILSGGVRYGLFAEKLPISGWAYFTRGISFCNIPLSMISEHAEWYGKYAVGVKRSSLREVGASPVFYVHAKTKRFPNGNVVQKSLLDNPFLCYIKQHYGKQYHKSSGVYKYKKFYDEKEWRVFVGDPTIEKYSSLVDLEDIRIAKDKIVPEEKPLFLEKEMIEYIILEKQNDFPEFDSFLKRQFHKERDEYLPKILYYSQIRKDF